MVVEEPSVIAIPRADAFVGVKNLLLLSIAWTKADCSLRFK
jgi:hypothetical protein